MGLPHASIFHTGDWSLQTPLRLAIIFLAMKPVCSSDGNVSPSPTAVPWHGTLNHE